MAVPSPVRCVGYDVAQRASYHRWVIPQMELLTRRNKKTSVVFHCPPGAPASGDGPADDSAGAEAVLANGYDGPRYQFRLIGLRGIVPGSSGPESDPYAIFLEYLPQTDAAPATAPPGAHPGGVRVSVTVVPPPGAPEAAQIQEHRVADLTPTERTVAFRELVPAAASRSLIWVADELARVDQASAAGAPPAGVAPPPGERTVGALVLEIRVDFGVNVVAEELRRASAAVSSSATSLWAGAASAWSRLAPKAGAGASGGADVSQRSEEAGAAPSVPPPGAIASGLAGLWATAASKARSGAAAASEAAAEAAARAGRLAKEAAAEAQAQAARQQAATNSAEAAGRASAGLDESGSSKLPPWAAPPPKWVGRETQWRELLTVTLPERESTFTVGTIAALAPVADSERVPFEFTPEQQLLLAEVGVSANACAASAGDAAAGFTAERDIHEGLLSGPAAEKLRTVRFALVPRIVSDERFWCNYLWRVAALRQCATDEHAAVLTGLLCAPAPLPVAPKPEMTTAALNMDRVPSKGVISPVQTGPTSPTAVELAQAISVAFDATALLEELVGELAAADSDPMVGAAVRGGEAADATLRRLLTRLPDSSGPPPFNVRELCRTAGAASTSEAAVLSTTVGAAQQQQQVTSAVTRAIQGRTPADHFRIATAALEMLSAARAADKKEARCVDDPVPVVAPAAVAAVPVAADPAPPAAAEPAVVKPAAAEPVVPGPADPAATGDLVIQDGRVSPTGDVPAAVPRVPEKEMGVDVPPQTAAVVAEPSPAKTASPRSTAGFAKMPWEEDDQ